MNDIASIVGAFAHDVLHGLEGERSQLVVDVHGHSGEEIDELRLRHAVGQ